MSATLRSAIVVSDHESQAGSPLSSAHGQVFRAERIFLGNEDESIDRALPPRCVNEGRRQVDTRTSDFVPKVMADGLRPVVVAEAGPAAMSLSMARRAYRHPLTDGLRRFESRASHGGVLYPRSRAFADGRWSTKTATGFSLSKSGRCHVGAPHLIDSSTGTMVPSKPRSRADRSPTGRGCLPDDGIGRLISRIRQARKTPWTFPVNERDDGTHRFDLSLHKRATRLHPLDLLAEISLP